MKSIFYGSSFLDSISFELVVPLNPITCFDDVTKCPTRDWAISGETLFFFIKTSSSVFNIDSLSFTCMIKQKRVHSRRSTFGYSNPGVNLMQYLNETQTYVKHEFPNMEPFRLETGEVIYPMKIQVPFTIRGMFVIEANVLRDSIPTITSKTLTLFDPFNIYFKTETTTSALIAQFNIECMLRMGLKLKILSTDVEIEAENPQILADYQSNIKITKPCNLNIDVNKDVYLGVVYGFEPLTENGASMLPNLIINFEINWSINELKYKTIWRTEIDKKTLGVAILVPPITAKVNQIVSVPFRLTNTTSEQKNIELVFDSGYIQPVSKRVKVPVMNPGSSTTVNISLLPLGIGYHQLLFWAEENEKKIKPLFPTYILVE